MFHCQVSSFGPVFAMALSNRRELSIAFTSIAQTLPAGPDMACDLGEKTDGQGDGVFPLFPRKDILI